MSFQRNKDDRAPEHVPWLEPWPAADLEALGHCPVCGATGREILHADLVDNTFFCAPGVWSLWSCKSCRTAYLDPRPTLGSIAAAYEHYYTHTPASERQSFASLGHLRKLRRLLVNGYTNWRYGTNAVPSSPLGTFIGYFVPGMRGKFAFEYRNLPRVRRNCSRVLDIGCGDGAFLELAGRCGWEAVGIDPDPKAAASAQARGLDVRHGGIELLGTQASMFDAITLSHVIEHLHDPLAVLEACYRLLKPNGTIWIDTPNIRSHGQWIFGRDWRGLEAPRHLVIFNHRSLCQALVEAGFCSVYPFPHRNVYHGMFRMSHSIRNGQPPQTFKTLTFSLKIQASWAWFTGCIIPKRREFLTMTAVKGVK